VTDPIPEGAQRERRRFPLKPKEGVSPAGLNQLALMNGATCEWRADRLVYESLSTNLKWAWSGSRAGAGNARDAAATAARWRMCRSPQSAGSNRCSLVTCCSGGWGEVWRQRCSGDSPQRPGTLGNRRRTAPPATSWPNATTALQSAETPAGSREARLAPRSATCRSRHCQATASSRGRRLCKRGHQRNLK